jgi:hypothetical protein
MRGPALKISQSQQPMIAASEDNFSNDIVAFLG